MARVFHRSRQRIRDALTRPQPQGYACTKDPSAPEPGSFRPIVDGILKADEQARQGAGPMRPEIGAFVATG